MLSLLQHSTFAGTEFNEKETKELIEAAERLLQDWNVDRQDQNSEEEPEGWAMFRKGRCSRVAYWPSEFTDATG